MIVPGLAIVLPGDPDAPMLYAYTIIRTNLTEPYTMVFLQDFNLEGIPLGDEMWIDEGLTGNLKRTWILSTRK